MYFQYFQGNKVLDKESEVTVSKDFYDNVRSGENITIRFKEGLLGIKWFTLTRDSFED